LPQYDHGPVRRDGFTARTALLALAGFWTTGVVMLVGSRFAAVGLDRFRHAPTCAPSRVFTSADCRIALDATLTPLTGERVAMDVDGRHVSTGVKYHGPIPGNPIPGNVAGVPVRVTFYRGVAVHVEGGDLSFDTDAAPVNRVNELRFFGLFCLLGGTFVVGAGALTQSVRADDAR
jgi:hypothetical protein